MPAPADASLTSFRYAVESTWNTSPTGAYREISIISEDLGGDVGMVTSEEIVSDRAPPDNIQTESGGSGNIVCDAKGGNAVDGNQTHDDFYLGALGSAAGFAGDATSSSFNGGGVTVTPANVGGNNDRITLTISGNTWNGGFGAGNVVSVRGFTGVRSTLNAVYEVFSNTVGNTVLTLTKGPRVPASPGVETPTAGTPFTVQRCGAITNGILPISFSMERKYSIANDFALLPGYRLSRFRLEMRPKRPVKVTFTFLGKTEISRTTTISSSVVPSSGRKPFSAVSDMKAWALGEDGHSFGINEFTLDFATGVYAQDEQAGTLGPIDIGLGSFAATGSVAFYYTGSTIFDLAQAFTEKSLWISWMNAAGDVLGIDLPRVNFKTPRRSTPGKDQAIKGTVEFQAARGTDPISGTTYFARLFRH
jgi:hypothetical protein